MSTTFTPTRMRITTNRYQMMVASRYGVAEYWVVDIEGRRVVTYREPTAKGYIRKAEFQAPDVLTPQSFPGVKIVIGEIFGDAA